MRMILSILVFLFTFVFAVTPNDSIARRDALTPDQKEWLKTAQNITIQALALTEKGPVNASVIQKVVSTQMQNMGLTVTEPSSPESDLILHVKCEERRSSVAMTKIGGDADQPGSPSRLWKGPACQLTYSLNRTKGHWRQEVRSSFKDAGQEARTRGIKDAGQYALSQLSEVLKKDDFVLELLAEWKQEKRMAAILTSPESSQPTKHIVVRLSKNMSGPTMLTALQQTMADPGLAPEAARAMGFMGKAAAPFLLNLLKTSGSVEMKAAAAEALGEIGAYSGDISILPTLLAMMDAPKIDLRVQTEIVKAVGKIPDYQSIEPLKKLGLKSWTSQSRDPLVQELREAIDWSLWQIDATDSSH